MANFSFNPSDANPVLPDGEYEAVIFNAETGTTKNGDPKLAVTLKVYEPDGRNPLVTDHIVEPFGLRRLKRLCGATGVDFDSGEVDPSKLVGQNVRVKLRVRHDDEYGDSNNVQGYAPDKQEDSESNKTPDSDDAESAPF